MASYVPRRYGGIALAAHLLCINAALSGVMQLGLGICIVIAANPMVVQLTTIGLVLKALICGAITVADGAGRCRDDWFCRI